MSEQSGKKRDFSPSSFFERIKTAPYKVGAVTAATDADPTHRRIANEIRGGAGIQLKNQTV